LLEVPLADVWGAAPGSSEWSDAGYVRSSEVSEWASESVSSIASTLDLSHSEEPRELATP